MKKKAFALALLLPALCLAGALGEEAPALVTPADAAVSKVAVARGAIAKMVPFQATVVPGVRGLSFSCEGAVGQVYVVPGQAVKAGEVLLELDIKDIEESIEALREDIAYAESLYQNQSRLREIDIRLLEMDRDELTDEKDIALKQNDIDVLRAQADEAYDTYQLEQTGRESTLQKLVEKTQGIAITAPTDGVVAAMASLAPGTAVLANEDVLWLADDTQLYVQCEFQKQDSMDAAAAVYALINGEQVPCAYVPMAERDYVAQTLMGGAMYSRFSLDMDTLPAGVHAGLSAAVCVVTQQRDDVLVVPSGAVYRSGATRFVYVIQGDQPMALRYVKTGIVTELLTEITDGLEEGELVYVKD